MYANFGDEMSVPPLVAGCEISIWRARLGEGESSESVAAGPCGEGDNVPCEFVPTLGGSGGGAMTHVIHYLRERTAPDAGLPSADEQFLARVRAVREIYSTLIQRIQMALLVHNSVPSVTQLQSAAERSEQFVARVAKYFEESNTQYVSSGTPNLTKLRDMRCAGTLARIGLLMEHRTAVMSEGRDTDNVFVNGQVG
ncbi:hypothetical protein EDB84DRAFT_1436685 [Lactarius hengduanensis]|nr:hypothetical protein EDB84DRAFT_1436685 [Lactarius hengduanensis]